MAIASQLGHRAATSNHHLVPERTGLLAMVMQPLRDRLARLQNCPVLCSAQARVYAPAPKPLINDLRLGDQAFVTDEQVSLEVPPVSVPTPPLSQTTNHTLSTTTVVSEWEPTIRNTGERPCFYPSL